jgi:cysteine desulfurase
MAGRLESLRQRLERRLATAPGFFVVGAEAPRVPNTACVGYEGIAAQSLLVALDLRGLAVSTGSACSSGALEPSHVLRAMGLPDHRTASALRFSLGWGSTEIEVDRAAEIVLAETARLRAGLAGQGGSTFPAAGR